MIYCEGVTDMIRMYLVLKDSGIVVDVIFTI